MTRRSTDPGRVVDDEAAEASPDAPSPPRDLADADAFVQRVRALRAASKHLEHVDQGQAQGQSTARYHADARPAPKPGEDTPHDAKVLVALPPEQALLREREQQARRIPTGPRLLAVKAPGPAAPRAPRPIRKMHLAFGLMVALAVGIVAAVVVARVVSSTPAPASPPTAR